MNYVPGISMLMIAICSQLLACSHQPTPEAVCHALEREKVAESCKEGSHPVFSVPRHGSQWTFLLAEGKESVDPVLGKIPKPSGVIIQFDSQGDLDVAVERLKGQNSVLPVLPFVHKLEKPPMLVLMPKHDSSLQSSGILERLYGYSK